MKKALPLKFKMKPYIQPFERLIAFEEMKALSGSAPISCSDVNTFEVCTDRSLKTILDRVAYWEGVVGPDLSYSRQVLYESTVNVVRNGIPPRDLVDRLPFRGEPPLSNRRCLRYGTHGLHEYRGKYFPQLVSGLMNIADVPAGGLVADPMCGSGTTAVESILSGRRTVGLDVNPLSVFMANVKCKSLSYRPESLIDDYENLRSVLLDYCPRTEFAEHRFLDDLDPKDALYLSTWFSSTVVDELEFIRSKIDALCKKKHRDFFLLALSNILRRVSYQKESDLRVRREEKLDSDLDPIREFLEVLGRSVRFTVALLFQKGKLAIGQHKIVEQDAKLMKHVWSQMKDEVDFIVTSPPYATALPYLDTDRLSLSYLGLVKRVELKSKNDEMIGNREISEKQRALTFSNFMGRSQDFPDSVTGLVQRIHDLNTNSDAGFRRRNLSALLGKYFSDMRDVMRGMKFVLKHHGQANLVVGVNRTTAGGEDVVIDTPQLLSEIGESLGFEVMDSIEMDMLKSRDIHRSNAIPQERILRFRKR